MTGRLIRFAAPRARGKSTYFPGREEKPLAPRSTAPAFSSARHSRLFFALSLLFLLASAGGCSLHSASPKDAGATASGRAVSQTALSAVGTRYVYGGMRPSEGFDCSGLVCWAYGSNGVNMPRTAGEQSRIGSSVAREQLRVGDVVVFRIKSGLHTGIYTGRGQFVHSPSSGKKVRVERLDNEYWRGKFIAGRRHARMY